MGRRRAQLAGEFESFTGWLKELVQSLGDVPSWFRNGDRPTPRRGSEEESQSVDGYETAVESLDPKVELDLSPSNLVQERILDAADEDFNGNLMPLAADVEFEPSDTDFVLERFFAIFDNSSQPVLLDSRLLPSPQRTVSVKRPLRLKIENNSHPLLEPEPLPKFPLFSLLPPEIRALIWKYTISSPRIVEIVNQKHGKLVLPNNPPPPTILQVCKESRAEALRFVSKYRFRGIPTYLDATADLFLWNVGDNKAWLRNLRMESPLPFRVLRRMAFLGSSMLTQRNVRWLVELLSECCTAVEEVTLLWSSARRKDVRNVNIMGRRAVRTVIGPGCSACMEKVNYSEKLQKMKVELESMLQAEKGFAQRGRRPPKVLLRKLWLVKDV